MTGDELREAIDGPARQAGLRLEPGLVELLVREVQNEPGALPLLSHALAETWARREAGVLTVDGYRATGGIQGAVAQSAEAMWESLPAGQQADVRALLLRLVTLSPDGEPAAARVSAGRDQRRPGPNPAVGPPRPLPAGHHRRQDRHARPRGAGPGLAAAAVLAGRGRRRPSAAAAPHRRGRGLADPGPAGQRALPRRPAQRRAGLAGEDGTVADRHRDRLPGRLPGPHRDRAARGPGSRPPAAGRPGGHRAGAGAGPGRRAGRRRAEPAVRPHRARRAGRPAGRAERRAALHPPRPGGAARGAGLPAAALRGDPGRAARGVHRLAGVPRLHPDRHHDSRPGPAHRRHLPARRAHPARGRHRRDRPRPRPRHRTHHRTVPAAGADTGERPDGPRPGRPHPRRRLLGRPRGRRRTGHPGRLRHRHPAAPAARHPAAAGRRGGRGQPDRPLRRGLRLQRRPGPDLRHPGPGPAPRAAQRLPGRPRGPAARAVRGSTRHGRRAHRPAHRRPHLPPGRAAAGRVHHRSRAPGRPGHRARDPSLHRRARP